MSADKSRAEVWADMIEASAPGAAAELRRLEASEAALIEVLRRYVQQDLAGGMTENNLHRTARDFITKHNEAHNGR